MPPLVFSEDMRSFDIVISVAHSSGFDPEATASRSICALVRETFALLKLVNVKTEGRFVLVEGKLGLYSIHLGSANVHKMLGGSLCIIQNNFNLTVICMRVRLRCTSIHSLNKMFVCINLITRITTIFRYVNG